MNSKAISTVWRWWNPRDLRKKLKRLRREYPYADRFCRDLERVYKESELRAARAVAKALYKKLK